MSGVRKRQYYTAAPPLQPNHDDETVTPLFLLSFLNQSNPVVARRTHLRHVGAVAGLPVALEVVAADAVGVHRGLVLF